MQTFYQMSTSPSSATPAKGHQRKSRTFSRPYVAAGCSAFNVIPCASDDETAVAGAGERRVLAEAA
jgi:hypothetical protein